jgi:cytochrome c biogenesis protein
LVHNLWRTLGSTRLAAILLAAVLLASLLASAFPQIPSDPAAYEPWLAAVALRYGGATRLFHALRLFDATRAPLFLALLAALLLNTLACTLQRWPRLWRALSRRPVVVRPDPFYRRFARCAVWPVPSRRGGLRAAREGLARRRYRIRAKRRAGIAYLYAERGRWGQVGTLVSHLAALLLALAVLARPALAWQEAGVTLLPGQARPVGHGRDLTVQAGSLTVERHPDGQPRDYRVPLTLLAGGSPAMTRTVRINHPLTYRGVAFHLQGYGPAARVTTPGRVFDLAFATRQVEEIALADSGPTLRVAVQPEGTALFVEALDADGALLGSGAVAGGGQIEVQGTPVTFTLSRYTVWQVSHDPTCGPAVGAGALLLAGTLISLWAPYRRLWLRVDAQCVRLVGTGDWGDAFDALAGALAGTRRHAEAERGRDGAATRPGQVESRPSAEQRDVSTAGPPAADQRGQRDEPIDGGSDG